MTEPKQEIQELLLSTLLKSWGFATLTTELKIDFVSSNFEVLLDLASDNVLNLSLGEVLFEFIGAEEALLNILSGVEPEYHLDNVNRHRGDETTYLSFKVVPINSKQPDKGLLILVEDVTQEGQLKQYLIQERNKLEISRRTVEKMKESLRQLDSYKSMFLLMAAHDLRTPLTVIANATTLQEQIVNDSDKVDYLAKLIKSQTELLLRLIGDMLDFDAFERGELTTLREPFVLFPVVQDVVEAMSLLFKRKQISFDVEYPETDLTMVGDAHRLRQVLFNLLSNAHKYTNREGHVNLRVKSENDSVVIEVADNGIGMTDDDLTNLFSPYFRSKKVSGSRITGTGLGLFIAKTLVEQHYGVISVKSTPDTGTTFTVRLPLPAAEPSNI